MRHGMRRLSDWRRRRAWLGLIIVTLLVGVHGAGAESTRAIMPDVVATADLPLVTQLPGRIEAEHYAAGGEGVGYHDLTPGNTGGDYRTDDVDIQPCWDPTSPSPCHNVGWIQLGEWLAYDIAVPDDASYVITARVASRYGLRFFHLELDGVRLTGPLMVPGAGGWQVWRDLVAPPVTLSAGAHQLRLMADTGGFNVNYFDVVAASAPPPPPPADVTVAAAGDIACAPADPYFNAGLGDARHCRQQATSDLLVDGAYDAVLALGDTQYDGGVAADYQLSYAPSWGRVKDSTHPAVGNNEYKTPQAAGYYAFFGTAAGDPARGYYSYDLGAWHIVVLNSNCEVIGGCAPDSPQGVWLAADLAAHPAECTLAYMHHPRYSSGEHGDDLSVQPLWQILYAANVDVVLAGHAHDYERFAPMDADGQRDDARGIRSFVVGTGGKSHEWIGVLRANSDAHTDQVFGVLKLTLADGAYHWSFQPIAGESYSDAGAGTCH